MILSFQTHALLDRAWAFIRSLKEARVCDTTTNLEPAMAITYDYLYNYLKQNNKTMDNLKEGGIKLDEIDKIMTDDNGIETDLVDKIYDFLDCGIKDVLSFIKEKV